MGGRRTDQGSRRCRCRRAESCHRAGTFSRLGLARSHWSDWSYHVIGRTWRRRLCTSCPLASYNAMRTGFRGDVASNQTMEWPHAGWGKDGVDAHQDAGGIVGLDRCIPVRISTSKVAGPCWYDRVPQRSMSPGHSHRTTGIARRCGDRIDCGAPLTSCQTDCTTNQSIR